MNSEEIKHIIDTHYKKLDKYSKKITRDFDIEMIHKFRVEYKKLRAFLRMISACITETPEVKIPSKLKKSYGLAGLIRDLQLQEERIGQAIKKGNRKPKKYLGLLQRQVNNLKPGLSRRFSKHPVDESNRETIDSVAEEFRFDEFENFASKKWDNIFGIIASRRYSDDNMHLIRKNLKDLFYNLKIFEGRNQLFPKDMLHGKDRPYLDQLLEELGHFQDKRMAISLLKTEWLNDLPVYDRQLLLGLKGDWIMEKKNMKQALIKKLETEFTPKQTFLSTAVH